MIVFQTNAANQRQNQSGNQTQEDCCRCPVLSTCAVTALIIGLVQIFLAVGHLILSTSNGFMMYLLQTVVFGLDAIAIVISRDTYTYASINRFCSFWTIVLIFQILNVASYSCIFWILDDGNAVTLVLTWVKFALFVVILILSIILYRKHQRNNDTIRYSNVEPTNVATNIHDRGQVAIDGRRPQNQDYLAQLSVVSETLYNDLPPRYEDLDQPPTYEESLQLQQQE